MLRVHQKFMYQASLSLSIFFNALTYVEVYISIKHPFWFSDKRMIWYRLLSVGVILLWYISYMVIFPINIKEELANQWAYNELIYYHGLNLFFVLLITLSVLLILNRLSQKGTTKQLKAIIIKRHLLYFIIFIPFIVLSELHFSRLRD